MKWLSCMFLIISFLSLTQSVEANSADNTINKSCYDMLDVLKTKNFSKIESRFQDIKDKSCVVPAKIWSNGAYEDYQNDVYYDVSRILECNQNYLNKKYKELEDCKNIFNQGGVSIGVDFKEQENEWMLTHEVETKSKKDFIKDSCFIWAMSISMMKSLSKEKDPYRISQIKKTSEKDLSTLKSKSKKYKEKYKEEFPKAQCSQLPFWYNIVEKQK